ncbi:glycoside hydrolase family 76 protein [Deminuibacter soli]|uniref:Glycoside hydrolase family 76 n=1 Tax=Deminuibacter soli TaxID=2291815 RepID=A0A3E1NNN0_9BACT|nr:glycoside hydrolase family 76 protein [Deminuibacter soli]RFM29545.1 glycoside hydrolase family 76 [Deminuibacter soli]
MLMRIYFINLRQKAASVFILLLLSTAAKTQSVTAKDIARQMNSNVFHYYYDSANQLFTEKEQHYQGDKPHSYLWPLCALLQAANEWEALYPKDAAMQKIMLAVKQYYGNKPPVPGYEAYVIKEGGDDRFYDDNQWLGISFIDAYQRTHNKQWLSAAQVIYRFMMTGYDTVSGGGLYWKEGDKTTKNTCSNGPGAVLALQLYRSTKDTAYLHTGLSLYNWAVATLMSPEGLFYDNIRLPAKTIAKQFYTYNSGTMLQSAVLLYEITADKKYLQQAQQMAAAAYHQFYKEGLYPSNYWFNAVLLRGYEELFKADHNPLYLQSFQQYLQNAWAKQTDEHKLAGTKKEKLLLDQGGLLEIALRMARLEPQLAK